MRPFRTIALSGGAASRAIALACLFCLSVTSPSLFHTPSRALAAGIAEDHTVLYYLIEMQRRATRTCGGAAAMPEAPSLMPSESLRRLAARPAATPPGTAAYLSGIPHLLATAYGATPRQAFDSLVSNQCSALMGREYRYIGASVESGQWTVILAAAEPPEEAAALPPAHIPSPPSDLGGPWPENRMREAAPASPIVIGTMETDAAGLPVGQMRSASHPAERAGSGTEFSENGGNYGPATVAELGASFNRERESAPAAPIVIGKMETDVAGRPVGQMRPVPHPAEHAGSGTELSENGGDYGPATVAELGASFNRERESAPAAPIVVRKIETDVTGKPILTPSASASSAAPAVVRDPLPAGGTRAAAPRRAARPGVIPLEDTRPPSAVPEQGVVMLTPQPFSQDGAASIGPGAAPVGTLPVTVARTAPNPATGQDMLRLVNTARAQGGVCGGTAMPAASPLRANAALEAGAAAHARDMTARGYFSSTTPEGHTLGKRVADSGYVWGFVAENLASGNPSAQDALNRWLANEAQCRNLMGAEYLDAGIGIAPERPYWVLILASPLDEGTPQTR